MKKNNEVIGFVDGGRTDRNKYVDLMYDDPGAFSFKGNYLAIYGIAVIINNQK